MKKIDWVFFDFDGTLVNSLGVMLKSYHEFLNSFGLSGSSSEFETLNGPSLPEIVDILKKKYELKHDPEILLSKYEEIMLDNFDLIKPIDGRTDLLEFLKNNEYSIALITSAKEKLVGKFLKKYNWNKFFDIIITSEFISKSKPDPEIYKIGLEKAKTNPHQVLVFEDSQKGIESAKNAGLHCIDTKNKTSMELKKILEI